MAVVHEEHPGYFTVAEVVAIYGKSKAYVYKLAHEKGWRRYWLDGKVRYHRYDVDDTLGVSASNDAEAGGVRSRSDAGDVRLR